MARYLVTGGAGFIGSHLCDALAAEGHRLVIVDDFSSGKHSNLERASRAVELVVADIGDGIPSHIGRVDAIVHLAAQISGYDSLNVPDTYVRSNITGLLRVIDFVVAQRVPRVVFASSSTVYGAKAGPGLTEQQLPEPVTVYAASKLMGEKLLAMYSALHDFTHCSLRLFNVYGPRQSTDHPYANVTCKFSHAAAHRIPVMLYGDGEQTRDFVYVDDVVRAFLTVLERAPSTVYNIGTGHETSINDLVHTLSALTGEQLKTEPQPEWPNDIRRIAADVSLARVELSYCAQVGIREGLERTVEYFRRTE